MNKAFEALKSLTSVINHDKDESYFICEEAKHIIDEAYHVVNEGIQFSFTDEQRIDLLTSAIEGGSNYWYNFQATACNQLNKVQQLFSDDSIYTDTFVWKLWSAIKQGMEIEVHDIETGDSLGFISMNSIERGEQTLNEKYNFAVGDVLSENDDAATGDVWLQCAVMNEVVYG